MFHAVSRLSFVSKTFEFAINIKIECLVVFVSKTQIWMGVPGVRNENSFRQRQEDKTKQNKTKPAHPHTQGFVQILIQRSQV